MEIKVVLLGEANSGKTSLLTRFTRDKFNNTVPTLTPESAIKSIGKTLKVRIWDVTGQDRFWSVARQLYRGAQGCLLVCDQSDRVSFVRLDYWLREMRSVQPDCTILLLCNKSDQPSRVEDQELDQFCSDRNLIGWMRVSAKTGSNVQTAFQRLAERLQLDQIEKEIENNLVPLEQPRARRWCW